MWAEIWECIITLVKLFCFLGVVGFIYYIGLVITGLENIVGMITGSIGILVAYIIFGGSIEMPDYWWIWNPACLMLSPALAVATIVCIWFIQD